MSDLPAYIGRYKIEKRLGRGGMGVVYLALDEVIERQVAVKVLRLDEADLRDRFKREIKIAGALSHPNIVRIYDAGEYDEQPFVAMEFVAGPTLDQFIRSSTPVSLDRKLELLIDLADGLAHAHARRVVHRDVKPSNLIIDEHDRLKILDFGIARFAAAGNVSLIVGTPSYMAPEQLRGEPVDQRCDLFAAGVVAYELLACRRPFVGDTHQELQRRILTDAPAPLQTVDPRLPRTVSDLVEVALRKRPEDRFQSAAAMGEAIRNARARLSLEESTVVTAYEDATVPVPDSSGQPATSPSPSPSASPSPRGPRVSLRVAEVRQRLLETAKESARRALTEGRIEDAVQAAEQALAVDDTDAEAAELLEQGRLLVDHREAERLLSQARSQIAAGSLVSARQTLEKARALWPDSTDIDELGRRVAQQVRDREEQVRRARHCAAAVARAKHALNAGDLPGAQAAVAEALAADPASPEALEVQDLVQTRVEEAAARARWESEAEAACRLADQEFAAGAQLDAIHRLEAFSPDHSKVKSLLTDLRAKRQTALDEQRRLAAAAKRQRQIEQAVIAARSALEARDVAGALSAVDQLDAEAQATDVVRQVVAAAESLRAAIERQLAERRAAGAAEATRALKAGDVEGARRVLDRLRAEGLKGVEIDQAVAATRSMEAAAAQLRQRQATLQSGLERVRSALDAQNLAGAEAAVRRLAGEGFTPEELTPATAAIAAYEAQRAEIRARENSVALARAAVERALGERDPSAARRGLAHLRDLGGPADLIASLQSQCADVEAALEAERRRREQREREGRSAVDAALTRRDEAEARRALDDLRRNGVADAHLADLISRLASLSQELAQERDLAQRREAASRVVAEALDARNVLVARDRIASLRSLGADHALLQRLDGRLTELEAELRQEAEAIKWRADQLALVERALQRRLLDEATAALRVLREGGARGPDIDACAARAAVMQREMAAAREHEARLDVTLADVTVAVGREDLEAAERLLRTLEGEEGAASRVDAARTQIATLASAVEARTRRGAELRRGLDAVERACAARQPDVARGALETLRRSGFGGAELSAAEQLLASLDESLRAEAVEAAQRAAEERSQRQAAEKAAAAERAREERRERQAAARAAAEAREAEAQRRQEETQGDAEQRQTVQLDEPPAVSDRREAARHPDPSATVLAYPTASGAAETVTAMPTGSVSPGMLPVGQPRRPVLMATVAGTLLVAVVAGWGVVRWASTPAPSNESAGAGEATKPDDSGAVEPPPDSAAGEALAREAAIVEALATARRAQETGQVDAAIAGLQQFSPPDSRIDSLRASLEALREANRLSDVGAFVTRLDAALANRDLTTASSIAAEGLRKFPNAPALNDGARRLALAARQQASEARNTAGTGQRTALYEEGRRAESRGTQLLASTPLEAFRQYRTAAEAYGRAAREPKPTAAASGGTTSGGASGPGGVSEPPTTVAANTVEPPPPQNVGGSPPGNPTPDTEPTTTTPVAQTAPPPVAGIGGTSGGARTHTADMARDEIQLLIRGFEAAYSAMDETRLRELQPGFTGIPGRNLLKSVRLTISDVRISLANDLASANVSGTFNYRYEWRRSGLPPAPPPAPLNWTVSRTDRGWLVR